jgi:hypothetical protein
VSDKFKMAWKETSWPIFQVFIWGLGEPTGYPELEVGFKPGTSRNRNANRSTATYDKFVQIVNYEMQRMP